MKLLVLLLLPCLSLSEVVLVPGFGNCNQFFLNNDPPQFTLLPGTAPPPWVNSVQRICQCVRDNNNRPNYLYATLYNTAWRIPIYSAYVFKSAKVNRVDRWYIEPQLDGGAEPCMEPKGRNIINNQAVNDDYDKSGYDRGHLYPVQHTYDPLSMLATSTLTNAAPQDSGFNRDQWMRHEKAVITDLGSCTVAYVVTGVVPDHNIPPLKGRVTVSKYYWRATCCLKNGVYTGQGYFGPDNNNVVQTLTITQLQTQLARDYKVNIVIFPSGYPPGGCI